MSSSVLARTGRQRQRYDNNFRLVSGCIPYRITENYEDDHGSGDIENKIQVLMVSSPDRHDRVFPKGGWEDDETVLEAACREAFEEAGVKGNLRETPLGVWEFRSKSREEMCSLSLEGGCRGYMFALEVTQELDTWPEHQNRDRKWLSIKEAFRVCRYEWMRKALEQFLRVMGGGLVLSVCDDNDNIDDEDGKVKVVEMMMGSEDEMKLGGELPPSDSTLQPPQLPLSDVEHVMAECRAGPEIFEARGDAKKSALTSYKKIIYFHT